MMEKDREFTDSNGDDVFCHGCFRHIKHFGDLKIDLNLNPWHKECAKNHNVYKNDD